MLTLAEKYNPNSMAWITQCVKTTAVAVLCWGMAGCEALYPLPGTDRVATPESSAVVGPLLEETEPSTAEKIEQATATEKKDKTTAKKTTAAEKNTNRTATSHRPVRPVKPAVRTRPVAPVSGGIAGKITILGKDNSRLPATGIIVRLTPTDRSNTDHNSKPQTHAVEMKNKTYMPGYLTVNKGDRLSFINDDNIRHNVFSSTGKNAFDLGTYGSGLKRDVAFNEEGIVKVYCNIHPGMAMFVAVGSEGLSTTTEADGTFSLKSVPPGNYTLHIWHIRGEKTTSVTIARNATTRIDTKLDTADHKPVKHKNKFGKSYDSPRKYRSGYGNDAYSIDDEYF
ncbi:hypothetical protein FKG94_26375 [Exilibacterium tricleocarpae]|uniref:Blue (type 1) copper domain-containing protein n=1 Tax=Exilibacterium tricleocarpae TaxID=2591008 RepID=A0A545SPX0_9GAMM|nr:carboxypeptidase regulatory-like domain-containing protein [Exilibacterium tricleocarpae]TQV66997.1 hypothetical protein FKG94_26375 [Exilibacterium tricleocarpae]